MHRLGSSVNVWLVQAGGRRKQQLLGTLAETFNCDSCNNSTAGDSFSMVQTKLRDTALLLVALMSLMSSPSAMQEDERAFITNGRLLLGTQENRSACVRMGDFNGDNLLDVVVANGRHWPQQNFVFLNQGRARFNLARPLGADLVTSYATEVADLNGDGFLDIAVGNDTAPNSIFLNDGSGHFRRHSSLGQRSSLRSLKLVDIDGDGDVDILVNARGMQNQIHLNDGSANFPTSRVFGNRSDSTIDVAVVDLNHDGHPDLILANRDGQQNVVLLNDGQTRFDQRIPFGSGTDETRAVAVGDLDGDGDPDWVTGNIGQANVIYYGNGKGGVRRTLELGRSDGRTYSLAIADMDKDGRPDIIVGNNTQRNAVFFNRGETLGFHEVPFGDESQATYSLAVGDLNQNGYPDIAVANSDGQNHVYINIKAKR